VARLSDNPATAFTDPTVWGTMALQGLSTAAELALVIWLAWVAAARR